MLWSYGLSPSNTFSDKFRTQFSGMERRKQVKGLLVPRSLSCEHRLFLTLYKSKNCWLVLSLSLSFFAFLVCFVVVDEGWGIFILDTNMITYVDVLVSPVNFMKNKSRLSFTVLWKTFTVIIRWNFFFLFTGREPTAWPANNILFMRKWNQAFLLLAIALRWKWQIASLPEGIN